jgi:hypothetical protein
MENLEGQSAAPTGTTPDPQTPQLPATPEAKSIIGQDGSFSEDWRKSLPEDIRGDKTLMNFKKLPDLARTVVNQQRLIGLDKKKLVEIPDDNAPDDIKNAFYKAVGRPEKPSDYKFAKDEKLPPEIWDDGLINSSLEKLHKVGASQKVIDTIAEIENARAAAQIKAIEASYETAQSTVQGKWGDDYEKKSHFGNLAIEKASNGNKEIKDKLINIINRDADLIEAMANLGANFAEHGNIKPNASPAVTKDEIKTKINELMASEAYNKREHPNHNAVVQQVTELHKRKSNGK